MIEFIGPLYNWLQQFTSHYLTHCHLLPTDTTAKTILTSKWTELNWTELNYSVVLLCTPSIVTLILFCSALLTWSRGGSVENTACSSVVFTAPLHNNGSYPIVACVFVAAGMCLPSRCLTMGVHVKYIYIYSERERERPYKVWEDWWQDLKSLLIFIWIKMDSSFGLLFASFPLLF
jgi:hypothetical protein